MILEPKVKQKSTLLFMHGLGDTPMGFSEFFLQFITASFIATKIILPTAPIAPVTINGGMPMPSWYDITSLEKTGHDFKKMEVDAQRNSERLIKILEEEKSSVENIYVGGFSQGCAMSLYLASKLPFIKGVIALSGYVFPFIDHVKQPTLMAHGEVDSLISPRRAESSTKGKFPEDNLSFHIMKGMDHQVNEEEMRIIASWFDAMEAKNSIKESL